MVGSLVKTLVSEWLIRRTVPAFAFSIPHSLEMVSVTNSTAVRAPLSSLWEDIAIWWAVPKKKVTRSKKRMKRTAQCRLKLREDIVIDPRTGETTLKHRLPMNWRDFLPQV